VESSEKGEILNDREQMSNCVGEGKGRSSRSEKFGKRENEPKGGYQTRRNGDGTRFFSFHERRERPRFASLIIDNGRIIKKYTRIGKGNYWQAEMDSFRFE